MMCGKLKIEVDVMNDLIEFLTSKEIIVVYIVAFAACLLCFIIYLIEKNNVKLKRRQNTRELNKLVEEIKDENNFVKEEKEVFEKPVLQNIESKKEVSSVTELLESTEELEAVSNHKVESYKEIELDHKDKDKETSIQEVNVRETIDNNVIPTVVEEVKQQDIKEEKEEELEYTTIEPDQATAQLELQKLREELKKEAEKALLEEQAKDKEQEIENIALTNYEEEQEENAIISLEELVRKSKDMYAANELTQYAEEGNEPISLQDLERQMGYKNNKNYEEPFIIANVVDEEELSNEADEVISDVMPELVQPVIISNVVEEAKEEVKKVKLDDFNTVSINTTTTEVKNEKKVFRSSPIISPIFGIEGAVTKSELELENTANYEKLDEEIKKTNEFLMTLKELQKKLD
jgi:hypothetical protein